MQVSHRTSAVFDDPNLIGAAGLVPLLALAEAAGLHEQLAQRLTVPSPNAVAKASSVIAGMLAGADSIDDLDLLRHGGMRRVFAGIRAPSTLGTFLRSFTFGHVAQLDAVNTRLLGGLTATAPGLLAGGDTLAYLDIDDTIRAVHGYRKQGAAYGYTGVNGLNAQLAVVSTPLAAPVITAARLRRGNAVSGKGAAKLLAGALASARSAGVSGRVLVRADSAYYRHDLIHAAIRAGAWFSITARQNAKVSAAISAIEQSAWSTINYPDAVFDAQLGGWVSSAQVAETGYTAFTSATPSRSPPGWWCAGSKTSTRLPRMRVNSSCSRPTATTRSSPTAPSTPSTLTRRIATTRSSSRSSPN